MPHTLSVEQKNWCGAILLHMTSNIAPGDKIVCNVEQFFMWSIDPYLYVEQLHWSSTWQIYNVCCLDFVFRAATWGGGFFMTSARMHRGIAYSSGWTLPTESCPEHKSELGNYLSNHTFFYIPWHFECCQHCWVIFCRIIFCGRERWQRNMGS